MPWNYHRVLTMRDNPLDAPGDWLDPRHAALDVSAHDWLRGLGLSERAIALAYGLNVSFGRDAHDVSALLLLFRGAFSKQQRALAPSASLGFTARHGVQRIPEAMAAALAGGVELDHAVVRIELEPTSAARHVRQRPPRCARGTSLRPYRRACCGASRSSRSCPRHRPKPWRRLPSQPLTQVYLAPRSRFWEQDGYAAEPVHRHARRHARRRAQSRRSDRGHEPHGLDHRRQRRGARSACRRPTPAAP